MPGSTSLLPVCCGALAQVTWRLCGLSLPLEIFKDHLDVGLGTLLWVALLEQGLGRMSSADTCHPQQFSDSVKYGEYAADIYQRIRPQQRVDLLYLLSSNLISYMPLFCKCGGCGCACVFFFLLNNLVYLWIFILFYF